MTTDNTELPVQVVNGGANDPFAAKPAESSPQGGASDGKAGDASATSAQADKTAVTPVIPQSVTDTKPVDAVSREEFDKLVTAARAAQSAADKQANLLREQLKTEKAQRTRIERDSKLSNEELSDAEKELLRGTWALEDKEADLEEREAANEELFRTIYIARSLSTAEKFGVTAEQLEACTEPEEMDIVCLRAETEFYRSGKHLTLAEALAATPNGGDKPVVEDASKVPAGAQAPTDLGGGGLAEPPTTLSTGRGINALMESLKATPAVSRSFN